MRILFLLTYYYPHWTGLTQYAKRLAEGLAKKKYNVSVLTTRHQKNLPLIEDISGVCVKRKKVLFRLSRTLVSFSLLCSFFSEIKQSDRIIVYLPFAEVGFVALVCKIFGKKLILVHNGDLHLPSGFLNRILEAFYFMTTKMAMALSSTIIIQTQDYANNSPLLSPFRLKWKVVLPLFPRTNSRVVSHHLLEKLNPKKRYTIGFAGRFVEEKGFDLLLQAIPSVLRIHPNAHFIYAGDPYIAYEKFFQKQTRLVSEYQAHLTFLGKLNQEEMVTFYRMCDVIVIPSRSDCFPSVEVEALLHHVPVVVTDIPGARWSVSITGMGVIVKPESPVDLAAGIVKALRMKNTLKKNYARVTEVFNWEQTLQKYEETFK